MPPVWTIAVAPRHPAIPGPGSGSTVSSSRYHRWISWAVGDRLVPSPRRVGSRRCSRAIVAVPRPESRSATCVGCPPAASRSNSGSQRVPSRNDMMNRGGTSGGSPRSSKSTSGTGTAVGPRARITRDCRNTSRCRIGSTPGGATLTTTRRSPRMPAKVRLDAPPANGRRSTTPAAASRRFRSSSCRSVSAAIRFHAGTAGF